MMVTNGFGAYLGSIVSGFLIDNYFTHNNVKDWHTIWLSFAVYALVIAILFAVMFKHKHDPKAVENVSH
jgi:NHS family xanthosine MFS transporter